MTREADESTPNSGGVNLDRILVEEVGQCGRYQMRVILLCGVVAILTGVGGNDYVFTFVKVRTRCLIPECENMSSPDVNFTQPWLHNALPPADDSFDNCKRYKSKPTNMTDACPADMFDRDSVVPCEEYVYEDKNSAIYDFNLACDDWRPYLLGSVNLFGMMVSLPLAGFISDRWGRRIAVVITIVCHALFGSLNYFSTSYLGYLIVTFISYVTGACTFTISYILALEYVGPEYRIAAGATTSSFLALGDVLKGLLSLTRPHWRYLVLILNVPMIFAVSYYWIIPESFRWLISKQRYEETKEILKTAAKINKTVLSEKTLQSLSEGDVEKKTDDDPWLVSLVFKHKIILFRCILTPFWWITTLFIHYGLMLSSVGILGNIYLNFSVVCAMQIPGYIAAALLVNRIGRKPVLISGYWICSACQIAYVLMPKGYYGLSLTVYLIGMLTISAVMTSMYVYTAELYPTRYRTTFLGYSSMVGRLGAIIAPLTPALSEAIWQPLPFMLFAGMALLCGALVTLAPETLGCPLPDTMQEAEDLGRHQETSILRPLRKLLFRRKCYTVR